MMRDNHYGWFERVRLGVYAVTDEGLKGLARYRAPTQAKKAPATSVGQASTSRAPAAAAAPQ